MNYAVFDIVMICLSMFFVGYFVKWAEVIIRTKFAFRDKYE